MWRRFTSTVATLTSRFFGRELDVVVIDILICCLVCVAALCGLAWYML